MIKMQCSRGSIVTNTESADYDYEQDYDYEWDWDSTLRDGTQDVR
jgi:hypothetical protein